MLREIYKAVTRLGGPRVRVEVFPNGDRCVVRSRGLREAKLPEIEISQCPMHLRDIAENLVLQIALNGRENPESLAHGKTIGGRFARADQPLIEVFRLVRGSTDSAALQITDVADSDGVFPYRLFATHLCATAGASRRDALRLLLVSIEVWPKEKVASNAPLGDYEFNPHNFWSWIDLGIALSRAGQIDEAILHWKTAVCLWPRGGRLYAGRMVAQGPPNYLGDASRQAVHEFWQSITIDVIRNWCTELAVELPDSAMTD